MTSGSQKIGGRSHGGMTVGIEVIFFYLKTIAVAFFTKAAPLSVFDAGPPDAPPDTDKVFSSAFLPGTGPFPG